MRKFQPAIKTDLGMIVATNSSRSKLVQRFIAVLDEHLTRIVEEVRRM